MNVQIGNIIKLARKKNKITLKDLAEKTGLSISYLSLMERGLNSPTLENLNKVCFALSLTLSDLITQAENSAAVIIHPEERATIFKNEGYLYQIAYNDTRKINCIFMTIDNNELHISNEHVNDEIGYVIEGSMILEIEGVQYEANAQDCIYIEAGKNHSYRKCGNEKCVTVWFNISGDVHI